MDLTLHEPDATPPLLPLIVAVFFIGAMSTGRVLFTMTTSSFAQQMDVEVHTFGPVDDDFYQVPILNRILTWGPNGVGYQARIGPSARQETT